MVTRSANHVQCERTILRLINSSLRSFLCCQTKDDAIATYVTLIATKRCMSSIVSYAWWGQSFQSKMRHFLSMFDPCSGHAKRASKVLKSEFWRQPKLLHVWLRIVFQKIVDKNKRAPVHLLQVPSCMCLFDVAQFGALKTFLSQVTVRSQR